MYIDDRCTVNGTSRVDGRWFLDIINRRIYSIVVVDIEAHNSLNPIAIQLDPITAVHSIHRNANQLSDRSRCH